jgi:hypothetical protein
MGLLLAVVVHSGDIQYRDDAKMALDNLYKGTLAS